MVYLLFVLFFYILVSPYPSKKLISLYNYNDLIFPYPLKKSYFSRSFWKHYFPPTLFLSILLKTWLFLHIFLKIIFSLSFKKANCLQYIYGSSLWRKIEYLQRQQWPWGVAGIIVEYCKNHRKEKWFGHLDLSCFAAINVLPFYPL